VELIAGYVSLQEYASLKWGRVMTVRREFRNRVQVGASELPLIMVTRPSVSKESRISGGRDNVNTIRLYVLFHQHDRAKAQSEVVAVEELIDDCLEAYYRIKDEDGDPLVKNVKPGESANDEGMFHPVYGIVMDVSIEQYR
jgi:hypothetical protein